jgi:glycosyltransferase involved in cell wall biosynthesis
MDSGDRGLHTCDNREGALMKINWLAWMLDNADGYGRQGLGMIRALSLLGHDVRPIMESMMQTPPWIQSLMGLDWAGLTIINQTAGKVRGLPGRRWAFSMWEDSIVSEKWVENINAHCERLIVPCAHNARVFELGGVKVPIHLVSLGVDPHEYRPLPIRPQANRPYTFMALADRGKRKGFDLALVAFCAAFPASKFPHVRLILKTREGDMLPSFGDPRISHWSADCDSMADVFTQADCFVYPSRGEGWGLPPREAVACGVPTIAPRHTGLEVGIDQWATVILEKLKLEPSDMGNGGDWYSCDYGEVAQAMTWCYEHRMEAREKALAGSAWLHAYQSWGHAAIALNDLLEGYV